MGQSRCGWNPAELVEQTRRATTLRSRLVGGSRFQRDFMRARDEASLQSARMALRAFLELPNRVSLPIGPAWLLIGRHKSCDLQLADQSVSRRHALLRISPEGVELVVLGQKPVQVGDQSCTAVTLLRADDTLAFPGLECRVRIESFEDSVRVAYCLRRGADRFPIHSSPFVIGSGTSARVSIADWPEEALRFSLAQGALYVEVTSGVAQHNDQPLEAGNPTALAIGDAIAYRDETFHLEEAATGDGSTITGADMLARAVVLHPLPRGGRIAFTFADGERTVYLPGRRFQLLSALLDPPPPHVAGEYVPDSEVIPLVWLDEDVGGRQDVNVLLTRCRQDLVAAGIAATSLIERAPGGRATRVCLAPGATITKAEE